MSAVKTLRSRIMVLFGSAIGVLLLVMTVILYFQISGRTVPLMEEFALEIAEGEAAVLGKTLEGVVYELKGLAQNEIFRNGSQEERERAIKELEPDLRPAYDLVAFINLDGDFYASTGARGNIADRDYFREIVHNHKTSYIGDVVVSLATGKPTVTIGHAIHSSSQQIVGVLAFSISVDALSQSVDGISIGNAGYGFVADQHGFVFAHPDQNIRLKMNLMETVSLGYSGLEEVGQRMQKGETGTSRVTRPDGSKELVAYTSIPHSPGWDLGITIPLNQLMNDVNYLLKVTIGIALGVISNCLG